MLVHIPTDPLNCQLSTNCSIYRETVCEERYVNKEIDPIVEEGFQTSTPASPYCLTSFIYAAIAV
ncbi:hypothetical protein M433DRAFT_151204 [Acidomyces richmondensis BFW]|nr:hypothetical protein M433DRAFT_151204 [Acidomyces richmondensis BFW]